MSPNSPPQLSAEPLELKERVPPPEGGPGPSTAAGPAAAAAATSSAGGSGSYSSGSSSCSGSSSGLLRPYNCKVALHRAVYDSYSGCIYFVEGRGLMRLDAEDVVTRVAGHRELCGTADGPGLSGARFQLPHSVTSDGAGNLLVADCGTVRRVSLPGPDAPPGTEATVATVYGGPWSAGFVDIAYDAAHGRLYAATMSAVYRLSDEGRVPTRIAGSEAAAAGGGGGSGSSGSSSSSAGSGPGGGGGGRGVPGGWAAVVAGAAAGAGGAGGGGGGGLWQGHGSGEGPSSGGLGGAAGAAAGAGTGTGTGAPRGFLGFSGITGLVVDGGGRLYVADRQQVYRLEADGGPGTIICVGKSDTSGGAVGCYPTLLPGGCLALAQYHDRRVLLLGLPQPAGGWAGGGLWGRDGAGGLMGGLGGLGLPGLMGPMGRGGGMSEGVAGLLALGKKKPGGVGEGQLVAVAVGGRAFTAHRLILAARCEYFRRLFAGGFADSGAREVVLQDADPDAFAALLRHMYTGELGFPMQLLRPLAELADRLLLPQVVRHVKRRLLAATQPVTVVADMLWAHAQGFNDLLENLKEWYLEHQREVLRAAPDTVRQLFTAAPAFAFELHCATVGHVAAGGGGGGGVNGAGCGGGAGGITTVSYNGSGGYSAGGRR
ncbi:hypothetical protein HYH02_015160 [Chlamydomonas schloesseri]|uniref:BTB domain-containing protein n=1 Tax=Chlamydomonas schloesseri TaxID=2026947 RepID=A0A835SH08_9CHLO|nr:hypothetical protein HYH02_015160 [Chlamydomonas schloesseri]|eukprot:KAG2424682.1 hypothetical protein HYH02_015160 [Chlamydomonas schloesseri]